MGPNDWCLDAPNSGGFFSCEDWLNPYHEELGGGFVASKLKKYQNAKIR